MAAQKNKEKQCFPPVYRMFCADLSLKRPGFCKFVVEQTENGQEITNFETMSVDNKAKTKDHGELLDDILRALSNFLPDDDQPTYFVKEKAALSSHSFAMIGMAKVCGLADWLIWRLGSSWNDVAPMSIKKILTGSGKAEKSAVAAAQKTYIGEHEYTCDDESDAAAAGVAWLIQNGQFKVNSEENTSKETETDA